eukprot:CAMPEP_0204915632 /NCGR_PEP_ID=MMETSP1397-20131031/13603_1 /ASSEMBLY_ACC=CAM_ASM_000891 /TAXON_ID=49980 /ORGANISM="Climacostomum Climacostomum virens, Strain Stock W-24" /LENGTH=273 /DNA_ID=CAMNT_0052087769 /DNA_START=333 /DNA_END=1151 /DNA_ORIENTATION=-
MILILLNTLLAAAVPFTASYWEVWNMHRPTNFASSVSTVPVSGPGTGSGAKRVSIAFADYGFTTDSNGNLLLKYVNDQVTSSFLIFGFTQLNTSIRSVKNRGGKASVAFGGATFSWSSTITTSTQASSFSSNVVSLASSHGLDGVEFSHVDPSASAAIFKNIIDGIRASTTTLEITYTIPGTAPFVNPWRQALTENASNLNFVQIMAYDTYKLSYSIQADIDELVSLGIAKSKIIIGMMPGCHDEPFNFTTSEDVNNVASLVKRQGMAGIALW